VTDEERGGAATSQRDAQLKDAADWFAQWQSGAVDPVAFARWRDADPAHALAFARVTALWERTESAPDQQTEAEAPRMRRRRLIQGSAAAAVMAAGGSFFFASQAYAWSRASTGVGETRKLRLPDNSMVALNTDSAIAWRFSGTRRELRLERGEVALDLRPGAEASLHGAKLQAELSEGRFNARLRERGLELLVLRGRAEMNGATVRAYHRLLSGGRDPRVEATSRDAVDAALAWQSGEIVFLDTPLAQAAAEYNRYLLRKIVIDDPSVGAIRVGGRFLSSDPADFLRAVSASLHVRVRATSAYYHLGR
jgi:transmembrane sensor